MNRDLALAWACLLGCCGLARAQFAPSNATPIMIAPPTSTMGSIVGNSLVVTPLLRGFNVSGQIQVSIPPAPVSGVLVQWKAERLLDPAFTRSGIETQTVLNGLSVPPTGTFATTSSSVITDFRFASGGVSFVGGSQSLVPMTLVNGVASPAWSGLTVNSVPFTWTAGFFPNGILQQQFMLLGSYTGGSGGTWTINVSVTSLALAPCPPDLTTGAIPAQPGYGVPNTLLTTDDFFYYLAQFGAGNLAVADLTTSAVPASPGYGVPNGILNNDDFFYYLGLYGAGC